MERLSEFLRRAEAVIPGDLVSRCIVFGSGPLVLAGLKEDPNDLDLFVDTETYAALVQHGFEKRQVKPDVWALKIADDVEAYETLSGVAFSDVSSDARPRIGSRGFPVAALRHVHRFKVSSNREKDRPDIAKLERITKAGDLVWRAAVHEAGHVLADHLHGFVPYEVVVRDAGDGDTHSRDAWPVSETASSYGISCMAGVAAEEVIGAYDGTSEGSASHDFNKANQALQICPGTSLAEWRTKAVALLETGLHRRAVAEIALELAERRSLYGYELHLVIGAALGDRNAGDRLRARREEGSGQPEMAILKSLDGRTAGTVLVSLPSSALVLGDFSRLDSGEPIEVLGRTPEDLERTRTLEAKNGMIELNVVGQDGMHEVDLRVAGDKIVVTPVPPFER